eukprot:scaffold70561_cov59-Phaeocystis_antarctica.AAC.2
MARMFFEKPHPKKRLARSPPHEFGRSRLERRVELNNRRARRATAASCEWRRSYRHASRLASSPPWRHAIPWCHAIPRARDYPCGALGSCALNAQGRRCSPSRRRRRRRSRLPRRLRRSRRWRCGRVSTGGTCSRSMRRSSA